MQTFSVWLFGKEVLAFHLEGDREVVSNSGGVFEIAPDEEFEETRLSFGFQPSKEGTCPGTDT